uniref:Uncharacterized protein n=1 Tax=Arundo donax TaxID=35708 RepID=A0A0A9GW72_ARUDO
MHLLGCPSLYPFTCGEINWKNFPLIAFLSCNI